MSKALGSAMAVPGGGTADGTRQRASERTPGAGAGEAETVLRVASVSKRFGGLQALADVGIAIRKGEIYGLIGPNGAGKTTFFNVLTGLYAPDSGTFELGGEPYKPSAVHEVAKAGIARTFQNIRLLKEASVLENVMIGFHRRETSSLLAALLGRFGMARYAHHPAGALAYGHQRRVEMMRALAAEPGLLLLDEPVAGMNDVEAGQLGEVFRGLADGGMGVLLIEPNMRFVTGLFDHVYLLDQGRLIAEGPPRAVVENPTVIAAYLGT